MAWAGLEVGTFSIRPGQCSNQHSLNHQFAPPSSVLTNLISSVYRNCVYLKRWYKLGDLFTREDGWEGRMAQHFWLWRRREGWAKNTLVARAWVHDDKAERIPPVEWLPVRVLNGAVGHLSIILKHYSLNGIPETTRFRCCNNNFSWYCLLCL